jgi:hypothetical protein
MNHENNKTQRVHEDNFVLLSALEPLWFNFKLTHYQIPVVTGFVFLPPITQLVPLRREIRAQIIQCNQ